MGPGPDVVAWMTAPSTINHIHYLQHDLGPIPVLYGREFNLPRLIPPENHIHSAALRRTRFVLPRRHA